MGESYGMMGEPVPRYVCRRTSGIRADGDLGKAQWTAAEWSPRFTDMVTGAPAFYETRSACLWDDEHLYIGFKVAENDIRAMLTERDDLVYTENDVEVFIAGKDCYYELEVNALGTIYEALFIWQDAFKAGGAFEGSREFALTGDGVDILGGFQDHFDHPRGPRWVFRRWDLPGLDVAVAIDGTLNDPTDIDRGWTVEMALPWRGMGCLSDGRPLPPRAGDVWKMNFFRFEALNFNGREIEPSLGWAWARHGVYDSHVPECFVDVVFGE